MSDEVRYPTLPHDDHYDDWTWDHILKPGGYSGPYLGADKFEPENVAEVELWHVTDEGGYAEHSAAGLFRMQDGSYVVYTGWCDTTGWGCRDGARFTFHSTREDAVRYGLGDEERGWFDITLED